MGDGAFVSLIPFLLLAATVLFAIGPRVNRYLLLQTRTVNRSTPFGVVGFVGIFIFSIYGGFFGAGLGVMLMAGLLLIGVHEPQQNNAIKNLLATAVTSIAVVIFALSGLIAWQQTACAFVGATIGGLFGSRLARVMSPMLLRSCVIVLGCTLSVYYFVRGIPR